VFAVNGEGTATIDGSENVTVTQSTSHKFTVVLTVGNSGITADAENPTFTITIPTGFTTPNATYVANAELVVADGNWSVIGGGTCLVESPVVGLTKAVGQVITVDVSTACTVGTGGTITLTYKGTSSIAMEATPLNIGVNDVISSSSVTPISTPPTITVTANAPAPVPMTISTDLPSTVKTGDVIPFTVTTVANDDLNTPVLAHFTIPEGVKVEYQEGGQGDWIQLENVFGPATTGFPVKDLTSDFRATFSTTGAKTVTVDFQTLDEVSVAIKEITTTVEAEAPVVVAPTPGRSGSHASGYINRTYPVLPVQASDTARLATQRGAVLGASTSVWSRMSLSEREVLLTSFRAQLAEIVRMLNAMIADGTLR